MTQEEKQLLLQVLSAMLPYGVVCAGITYELDDDGERYVPFKVKDTLTEIHNYKLETASVRLGLLSSCKLETVKPYLRSMDSMTEEEGIEWFNYHHEIELEEVKSSGDYLKAATLGEIASIDWLNKNHFDYRGLIPMGLAIEVNKNNNPYKD